MFGKPRYGWPPAPVIRERNAFAMALTGITSIDAIGPSLLA